MTRKRKAKQADADEVETAASSAAEMDERYVCHMDRIVGWVEIEARLRDIDSLSVRWTWSRSNGPARYAIHLERVIGDGSSWQTFVIEFEQSRLNDIESGWLSREVIEPIRECLSLCQ